MARTDAPEWVAGCPSTMPRGPAIRLRACIGRPCQRLGPLLAPSLPSSHHWHDLCSMVSWCGPDSKSILIFLSSETTRYLRSRWREAKLSNAWRVWRRTMDVRMAVSGTAPRHQTCYHRSKSSLYIFFCVLPPHS